MVYRVARTPLETAPASFVWPTAVAPCASSCVGTGSRRFFMNSHFFRVARSLFSGACPEAYFRPGEMAKAAGTEAALIAPERRFEVTGACIFVQARPAR